MLKKCGTYRNNRDRERSDMDSAADRSRPPSRLLLVLPGLAASDVSTRPLRTYLRAQGYAAHGWKQGPNHGPRSGVEAGIDARLAELALHYNRKVSLIGWSLGGVFAREAARRSPDLVRQ